MRRRERCSLPDKERERHEEGMRTNRRGIPIQRSNNGRIRSAFPGFPFVGDVFPTALFATRQPGRYPACLSNEISARLYVRIYIYMCIRIQIFFSLSRSLFLFLFFLYTSLHGRLCASDCNPSSRRNVTILRRARRRFHRRFVVCTPTFVERARIRPLARKLKSRIS